MCGDILLRTCGKLLYMKERHETLPVTCGVSSTSPLCVANHRASAALPRTRPPKTRKAATWLVNTVASPHGVLRQLCTNTNKCQACGSDVRKEQMTDWGIHLLKHQSGMTTALEQLVASRQGAVQSTLCLPLASVPFGHYPNSTTSCLAWSVITSLFLCQSSLQEHS